MSQDLHSASQKIKEDITAIRNNLAAQAKSHQETVPQPNDELLNYHDYVKLRIKVDAIAKPPSPRPGDVGV